MATHCTEGRRVRRGIPRLGAALLAFGSPFAVAGIIPNPAELTPGSGAFTLGPTTAVVVPAHDVEAGAAARYLTDLLKRSRGISLAVRESVEGAVATPGAIVFRRREGFGSEAYSLVVDPKGVALEASAPAGLFYAAVSLFELVPGGRGAAPIAAVTIKDAPTYAWRGLMLDSARHFQSPAFIRTLLDAMALHKLNVLHWHLTDDQGWRLEIRRYPKLTEVGGWRVPAGRAAREDLDPKTHAPRLHGGFYSQATVRELVAYAAARQITIVPEIEMPGHASAALAAYPELGVAPTHLSQVPADWGIYPHLYNVSEATCQFLENVLAEVVELFPGRYVHVGGDEVVTSEWLGSESVNARVAELGLKEPKALHSYLVQRMGRFLAAHDRRLVGWDEILEPGLSRDATILSWHGADGARRAAEAGNDAVLAPWPTLYFDFRASGAADEPPGRVTLAPLKDVYAFNPEPAGLEAGAARHVLGLEAAVWTEHIRLEERVGHATFPRAAAVAEVGWTPLSRRDYDDFLARLPGAFRAYRLIGMPYSDSDFAVRANRRYDRAGGAASVELSTESGRGEIRFTRDATDPTAAAARYREALSVATPATLTAASFAGTDRLAASRHYALDSTDAHRRSSHALELCSDHIALALEVDSPPHDPRPVVRLDIMDPCWIYRGANLSAGPELLTAVGPVPFNYQIGDDIKKVRIGTPQTPAGELEVRLDGCEGEPIARVPLAPAVGRLGVTPLAAVRLPPQPGAHDVCLRFARPSLDPMWALDWVEVRDPVGAP